MSTKKKLIPKRGAQKQAQPTPLKINKPKSPKAAATKKVPAAAAKAKKPRAKPAPVADAFGADEDEIKLPELAEGEEDLPTMGGADSGAGNAESSEELAGKGRDEADVPDPFASDDEEAPAAKGETALGKRQRQTLQEEKAAELRKLKSKELARRKAAAAESAKGGQPKARGVIYVGHIPYGFFESQMKAYFSQFGEVLNIRLSRNKKTGKPKHYAFVEFENEEVARIVAETMNGYFLYGKTLVVKVVPAEKLHPATFVGANRTYRVVPWRQIAQKQHNKPRTPEEAEKRQTRLLQREAAKRKKLAEMGIDYDFKGYKAQEIPKATRVVFE